METDDQGGQEPDDEKSSEVYVSEMSEHFAEKVRLS